MTNLEIALIAAPAALFVLMVIGFTWAGRRCRTLKTDIEQHVESIRSNARELEARLQDAEIDVARLQSQVRELEEQAKLVSGAQAKSWTNISRRTQAVRMLRNGATPDRIANELSITRGEVDLIRKIQRLTSESSETAAEFTNLREASISAARG